MEIEKMKDIKEGLECLAGYKPCNLCSYHELAEMQETCCINVVAEEVIEYINELESENERLSKENFVLYRDRFTKKELDDISAFRVTKATKELKDRIAELEKENARLLDSVETVQSNRCTTKCELTKRALKQFAERLKEKAVSFEGERTAIVSFKSIDETLKEFINETNE